ncbi:hypothetical protein CS542_05860 [Pedobacter sp. IW39]|nr:hypothetical protein CS542_05860 [Pedobacter sp. IW39]
MGFGPKPIIVFPDSTRIGITENVDEPAQYSRNELFKSSRVQIDLNGIAQGYSVDVVADYLLHKGIRCLW